MAFDAPLPVGPTPSVLPTTTNPASCNKIKAHLLTFNPDSHCLPARIEVLATGGEGQLNYSLDGAPPVPENAFIVEPGRSGLIIITDTPADAADTQTFYLEYCTKQKEEFQVIYSRRGVCEGRTPDEEGEIVWRDIIGGYVDTGGPAPGGGSLSLYDWALDRIYDPVTNSNAVVNIFPSLSGEPTQTSGALPIGTYRATFTDLFGCSVSFTVTICEECNEVDANSSYFLPNGSCFDCKADDSVGTNAGNCGCC